jgi:hypothetical protein
LGTHPTVHQTVKQQIPNIRHNLNKETTINFELIGKNSITNQVNAHAITANQQLTQF